MTVPLQRPATADGLFLWVMHRFAEVFEEHAVLKGGIALRLLDCPRSTTDIDYVFVPFRSKAEIVDRVRHVLAELSGATVEVAVHSKMLRARVTVDAASIQIEANVGMHCATMPLSTGEFARQQGQPARIVRLMAPATSLANKLAAWNERRLVRDLYDVWFLRRRVGAEVDLAVLDARLRKIESRHPALAGRKRMTRDEFAAELQAAAGALSESALQQELAPLLPAGATVGMLPRLRGALVELAEILAPLP